MLGKATKYERKSLIPWGYTSPYSSMDAAILVILVLKNPETTVNRRNEKRRRNISECFWKGYYD